MGALEIDTPEGPARAHVHAPSAGPARVALVLGHGAGGGVAAPDLIAVRDASVAAGHVVVLVEQPYRVAGKKSTPPPPRLDRAWTAVVAHLRAGALDGLELISGGRSAGARVACRTAAGTGAAGVVCLAFPLVPPTGRRLSRIEELEDVEVPVLVVQGTNDRFGMPPADPPRRIVAEVPGDHALRRGVGAIGDLVADWVSRTVPSPAP